jgi:hypothetical protein
LTVFSFSLFLTIIVIRSSARSIPLVYILGTCVHPHHRAPHFFSSQVPGRPRGVVLAIFVPMRMVSLKMKCRSVRNSMRPSERSRQPRMLRRLRGMLRRLLKLTKGSLQESTTRR